MDPKKQAEMFYKSLAAADAVSCRLLARGAAIQRGRAAAIQRRLDASARTGDARTAATHTDAAALRTEITGRQTLADKFAWLGGVIDKAITDRAELDQKKSK